MTWKAEEFERKYREVEKLSTERENTLNVLREAADANEKKKNAKLGQTIMVMATFAGILHNLSYPTCTAGACKLLEIVTFCL